MGVVYLAEDRLLGRRVAMKFLSKTSKEYRTRFLAEARAVSALSHPNIAAVFDYGETTDGQPYIVMELIEGQPLNEKLIAGSLPLPEAVRVVSFIAEALGEAHHRGIVHRDVKPSNVVITDRGLVKVLDFGLVKQIAEQANLGEAAEQIQPFNQTRSDVIIGTPLYLSPEQATGKKVDGRSDLFALGAVFYECLTGQSAFTGNSVLEIGAQVIHVTPEAPSKLNPRIPAELDRITMKAIEKKVEDRYQSADELIADLRQVLPTLVDDGHRHLQARATTSAPRLRTGSASALTTIADRLRRPGPPLGMLVAGLLGLALVVFLIALWLRPSTYVPRPGAQAMYDQGTEALRSGSFLQATKALEETVRIDDKFAMAHARLAEAWYELDYADKAKDEMLKAQPVGVAPQSLPRLDTLYLEAIHATVTQDFPGAVKVYKEIARLSPGDAHVHLDLGRAYEKNDQLQDAADSYKRASELAPQHPTAFLRLAVMNGKQIDLPSAFANFDRADTLYQASGNYEGQAEVAYQRGFLLNQNEKFPEARQQLERALGLARTTHSEYEEVKSLLKLGEVIVAEGKADEGRRHLQQAIDLAQARGIDNYVKRGLIDLGNSFMLSREYPKAEEYFKQSLELSQRQKDPRNVARALLSLGSVSERQNNLDQAVAYVEQSLPFYQRGGYRREMIQALAVLARAKRKKGEYDAALKAFEEELKLAQTLGDQALIAQSNVDIGIVLMNQAHYPKALRHFEEGYAIAKGSSYQQNIGLYLTNRANALWNLGRYSEADPLLSEVSAMAARPDGKGFANWYHVSAARLALTRRQFEDAQRSAEQAMTFNASQPLVETSLVGFAQVLAGASRAGRLKCEDATLRLTPATDPLIAAEVKLGFAEALLQTGDAAAAVKIAVEAKETFARLGKPDFEWLALLIAARASINGNAAAPAREYASQAETLLAGLEQRWGNDNFQSYLNRPDVKFNRNQLNEILEQKP